jgi:alpha-tubulin suppressor-like RCC1 family protein
MMSRRLIRHVLAAMAITVVAGCDVEENGFSAPAMTAITVGDDHSCSISESGAAYCWGKGTDGQLGTGRNASSQYATGVAGDQNFIGIDGGGGHTCGLTGSGQIYCWGANESGQLGNGTRTSSNVPTPITTNERFIAVSAGFAHSCAITLDGRAICWGSGVMGETGTGALNEGATTPASVATDLRFTKISAGFQHTCAITAQGEAFCWGANELGQLGIGGPTSPMSSPVRVPGAANLVQISAGRHHTCGATADLGGLCWGANAHGELGMNATWGDAEYQPVSVNTYDVVNYTQIIAGNDFSCSVWDRGFILCWGRGDSGQLGNAKLANHLHAQQLARGPGRFRALYEDNFAQVDASSNAHACGLSFAGKVYCWGWGPDGQLGTGHRMSAIPYPLLQLQ